MVGDVSTVLDKQEGEGEKRGQITGGMGGISSYNKIIVVNIDSTAG